MGGGGRCVGLANKGVWVQACVASPLSWWDTIRKPGPHLAEVPFVLYPILHYSDPKPTGNEEQRTWHRYQSRRPSASRGGAEGMASRSRPLALRPRPAQRGGRGWYGRGRVSHGTLNECNHHFSPTKDALPRISCAMRRAKEMWPLLHSQQGILWTRLSPSTTDDRRQTTRGQ